MRESGLPCRVGEEEALGGGVVYEVGLGQADAGIGLGCVEVPKVPSGVRLASERALLPQAAHEDRPHVLEEGGRLVELARAVDAAFLANQPKGVHHALALHTRVGS